jgi:hypothetical protein
VSFIGLLLTNVNKTLQNDKFRRYYFAQNNIPGTNAPNLFPDRSILRVWGTKLRFLFPDSRNPIVFSAE